MNAITFQREVLKTICLQYFYFQNCFLDTGSSQHAGKGNGNASIGAPKLVASGYEAKYENEPIFLECSIKLDYTQPCIEIARFFFARK